MREELKRRLEGGNEDQDDGNALFDYRRNALSETIITTIVALLVLVLVFSLMSDNPNVLLASAAVAGLVTVAFVTIRYTLSPDRLRAVQAKRTLSVASKTLEYMRDGLSTENCQEVCKLILPETQAMAVAMTDDQKVLGYAGEHADAFPVGSPIHTRRTLHVLKTQQLEVFTVDGDLVCPESLQSIAPRRYKHNPALESGDDPESLRVPAGIVVPLVVRGRSVGTLKLYYEAAHLIDATQCAIASGLGELLATQLHIAALDKQVELATKAELQALQSQINPHFLFNTINTIASLIRTDPARARNLLREFAVFYRQTLDNSTDLIPLERELQQTSRYLTFAVARFGEDRIVQSVSVEPGLEDLRVPSFLVQPLVENAVNHAIRPEGTLHVSIKAYSQDANVLIVVSDDGIGMGEEQVRALREGSSSTSAHAGIALRNVDARLNACYGRGSGLSIESHKGEGTVVTLTLAGVHSCQES